MKFRPLLSVALMGATALPIAAQPVWLGGPANPITNTIAFAPAWSLIGDPLFHFRREIVSNAVPDTTVAVRLPLNPGDCRPEFFESADAVI